MFSNGRSLGKAFEDFNAEGGITYFPALTLFNEESIHVNLGERQFKFPISGAKPVIANPITLTDYFQRLELNMNALIDVQIGLKQNVRLWHLNTYKFELVFNKWSAILKFQTKKNAKTENKIIVNNVINKVLVNQFVSLSKIPLIADSCLISFLTNLNKKNSIKITVLFELLWANTSVSKIFSIYCLIFKGLNSLRIVFERIIIYNMKKKKINTKWKT